MDTLADMIVRERVNRGVALLDEYEPHWRDLIVPERLRLTSACDCVLGQVFDRGWLANETGFRIGIRELGISGLGVSPSGEVVKEWRAYGFEGTSGEDVRALTAEWLRRLS